jgi:hypothetical protein
MVRLGEWYGGRFRQVVRVIKYDKKSCLVPGGTIGGLKFRLVYELASSTRMAAM